MTTQIMTNTGISRTGPYPGDHIDMSQQHILGLFKEHLHLIATNNKTDMRFMLHYTLLYFILYSNSVPDVN